MTHRVGVLVPSTDTTVEQELPKLLNGRASMHATRMHLPEVTPAGLATMEEHALAGAALLADAAVDVVLFACTSGSFFRGAAHERELAQRLAAHAEAPVVTTAWAVGRALSRHGRTVRVRTPYTDELTAAECAYLRDAGLETSSSRGLGLTRDADIAALTRNDILSLAEGSDPADAVLLSCTNLPTIDVLDEVEKACAMPIVTSNTAGAALVLGVLDGSALPLACP